MAAGRRGRRDGVGNDGRLELAADTGLDVGLLRPLLAAGCVAVLVALFAAAGRVQRAEAALSALVVRRAGLPDAHRAGASVVFTSHHRFVGYDITLGCTVGFLVVPFFAVTAVLLVVRRVAVARSLLAVATAVVVVEVVNQLRLLTIAAGIHVLGLGPGYSLTHVAIGTSISTVGIVLAAGAYVTVLVRGDDPSEALRG